MMDLTMAHTAGRPLTPFTNIVYIFVGCIVMGGNWWKYVVGTVIVLVGIGYVVLEYIPSIEPPANMR